MRVLNEKITSFLSTLNLGLSWIADAGRKLVVMVDEDPNVFEDIIEEAKSPWLTKEVLQTIEAIGRGEISPEMLILPVYVARRLAPLSTADQIRAINGVPVMVPSRNGRGHYQETIKRACNMTPSEANRAIGPDGIRSVEEQSNARRSRSFLHPIGKYQIVKTNGDEPTLVRISDADAWDYRTHKVKLEKGCAVIALYL